MNVTGKGRTSFVRARWWLGCSLMVLILGVGTESSELQTLSGAGLIVGFALLMVAHYHGVQPHDTGDDDANGVPPLYHVPPWYVDQPDEPSEQ